MMKIKEGKALKTDSADYCCVQVSVLIFRFILMTWLYA